MSKYAHHKYTYTKPFGSPRHNWELVGPAGAIHFHATLTENYPATAGLEFHHATAPRANEAPSQLNCPLTGGRCWHDGMSIYATETLWPRIERLLRDGDHDAVFAILEREYDERFDTRTEDDSALDAALGTAANAERGEGK